MSVIVWNEYKDDIQYFRVLFYLGPLFSLILVATYLDILVIIGIVLLVMEDTCVLGYIYQDWKVIESQYKHRKDEKIYVLPEEKGKSELQSVLFIAGL